MALEDKNRRLFLTQFEKNAWKRGFERVAGVDEVGRGPLAGPVVAAACIIPKGIFFKGINDSKQLDPPSRKRLFALLKKHPKVFYGIGKADVDVIDSVNIYQATIIAMKNALYALPEKPDYLLVDGMGLSFENTPCEKIIDGDAKSQAIAAASIIAKETRDQMMREYHLEYPQYGFDEHKGYATKKHLEALKKHGPTIIHRRSFAPCKEEMADKQIDFFEVTV